jgi:nucleoside phosphorylase/5'-deoxynucleotidase YfbR-like HD superfamily hydrolase
MAVDIVILVALSEEADELSREHFYPLSPEKDLENFKYQEFAFMDYRRIRRTGLMVCAGEVGQRSRDAASLFAREHRPQIILNVGISGRVNDARVGDVVVPTYVNSPGHRSAIVDGATGGYQEIPGGNPYNVSARALSIVRASDFRRSLNLPSIEEFARKANYSIGEVEISQIRTWKDEGLISSAPTVVAGPFAADQPVIKSTNYKRDVLGHVDRNIIALDMESAFIAAAIYNLKEPPAFFAIRAISDPANEKKKQFDAIGGGIFRQWAMSNIRTTLRALLETTELLGSEPEALSRSLINERPDDDYLSDYPGQRLLNDRELRAFDDRFSNISVVGHPYAKFSDVVRQIEAKTKGGRALIQGRGGTGKSALIKRAEMEIKMSGRADTAFINLRKLFEKSQGLAPIDLIREKLSSELNKVDRDIVIFLDELYGNDDEGLIIDEIESLLADRDPAIVLAFGQDHYDVLSVTRDTDSTPHVYDRKYDIEVDVKAISIHKTDHAIRVISGIIETSIDQDLPEASDVLNRLSAMGFLYINHFIVSIYLDNWRRRSFEKLNSTQFILKSMELLYNDLYPGAAEKFHDLCVEALRAYCRGLAQKGFPSGRKEVAERYQTSFAHFPKIVQTNLVGNAIVHLLRLFNGDGLNIFNNVGVDPEVFFGLVFTGDVNNAVKELLRDKKIEEDVISAANKILERADDKGLSYAVYLFGRANSPRGLDLANEAMSRIAPQFSPDAANGRVSYAKRDKFWRMARRSWHISRAMKDDRAATDQYVHYVLTDPYEDELNRSFHLEYYGDYKGTGITVELDLRDSGENWSRTKEVLSRRVERLLSNEKVSEYDRICLLTYFSIVRHRHEAGKLLAAERDEGTKTLDSILQRDLQLRPELSGFLSMVKNALRFDRYDKIDALVELFKFKMMPRFGWDSRRMFSRGAIVETIASHTWGALFLAEVLSDYVVPTITDDERYLLLRILLHHDLGEADIGDFDPRDGTTKGKEPGAIERIASLATYEGLDRLKHIRPLFDEFEHGTGDVVQLARTFDRLDAIFQGYIYADKFPDRANRDEFFGYYLKQIKNDKLLQIAEEVVRRANMVEIARATIKNKRRNRRGR